MGIKKFKIQLLSLFAVFVLAVAALCFTLAYSAPIGADAATYTPSNIFGTTAATSVTDQGYVAYNLYEGSSIYYRKNLALKWYQAEQPEGDAAADLFKGTEKYFELEFSLGTEYHFNSFSVTMEAGQFVSSKEGKSSNKITFTVDNGALKASVNDGTSHEFAENTVTEGESQVSVIKVAFTGESNGEYTVTVNGTNVGVFENIGKFYAQYAASTADTPITPLTFKVDEFAQGQTEQLLVIRSLNGQSLALNDSGSVEDTEAPVLVVNSDVRQFMLGAELDFDYVVIDVLDSSVTTTRYYYGYDAENPRVAIDSEDTNYERMDSNAVFFEKDLPSIDSDGTGYLSVAFNLDDGDNDAYYFIEWYAAASDSGNTSGFIEDDYGYIKVVKPDSDAAPSYTFNDTTAENDAEGNPSTVGANDIADYQKLVNQAAVQDDGTTSIQVGSGAYFYLPSLKAYITDATCGYTDMQFDIYYRTPKSDTQSLTGLAYDELEIELTAEGKYEFRIVPTNTFGNAIIAHELKDGVPQTIPVTEITSSNVWDLAEIPTFTFTVKYNGVAIEEPEEADDGYIDVTYTSDGFEIISLEDDYNKIKTEYKLYYLEVNASYAGRTISKEDLKNSLMNMSETGECEYGTWRMIEEENADEDEDYGDNVYAWNPSSALSFIPQETGYYGITVSAKDQGMTTAAANEAVVISVSSEADVLPGETYWLQNNILSVVFMCIGGVCLIGIVVLLLIKPKDKKVVSVKNGGEAEQKQSLKEKRKKRK